MKYALPNLYFEEEVVLMPGRILDQATNVSQAPFSFNQEVVVTLQDHKQVTARVCGGARRRKDGLQIWVQGPNLNSGTPQCVPLTSVSAALRMR